MIWDSTLLMATIDVVIVLGAITVLCVSFRHRATISRMQVSRSAYSIAAGTCIIAALYLADLYVMLILPLYTAHDVAVAAMRHLHLNWSWIAVLAGLSCIVAGLIPLLAKLFPRIEGIIGSLEMEVAERKRAETRLQEAHDRQESRVDERTKELREINQRLVREIAERVRSEKINTRLGRIVEDSVNEIYVFDGDTLRFIQVNRGARENLGYSIEELRGLTPLELKPEHTAESFAVLLQPLLDGSADQIAFNTVHRRKDGTSYDVVVRLQLARGESSPVFFAVIQDITEQKRAEAALRESETSLTNAQRMAQLGNYEWDLATGELRWSDEVYRIFNVRKESFEPSVEAFKGFVHPDDREMVRAVIEDVLDRNRAYDIEFRILRADGSERILRDHAEVTRNKNGRPIRLQGAVLDITERARAEAEIRRLNESLERQVEERTAELRESEGRLALAVQSANFGTWSRSIPSDRVFWDARTEAIYGLEPGAFEGTMDAVLDRVHPDDRERITTGQRSLLEEGLPYAVEFRIFWPNGELRYVGTWASVVRDDRDSSLQIIGITHDITERKRAEEALRDSEEQLRLITDNVPAVIAYVDADQRYRFINKRYEEWYGISSEEAFGRRVGDVLGEATHNAIKDKFAKALSGELIAFETSIQTTDAGIRDVQPTYVPHFSDDGTIKGVFVLVTDITERKRLESELLRRERLATLGQLTATVSHELRNPLGVIRTSAFTLRGGLNPDAPRAMRALERVERSVIRCDRIIDELLDFTRISGLEPEPTALDDWLDGVLEEQALPAGVALRRDFGLAGAAVSFDHDRFRRAVINVFDNACQAMLGEHVAEAAPGERVLTVRTQARDGRVEVIFEDQGPGIPVEIHERIFEPLFSTKGFGVGLGLPVVKRIMERHGGGIEVESEQGRGTTVCLWLDSEGNHTEADHEGAAA